MLRIISCDRHRQHTQHTRQRASSFSNFRFLAVSASCALYARVEYVCTLVVTVEESHAIYNPSHRISCSTLASPRSLMSASADEVATRTV